MIDANIPVAVFSLRALLAFLAFTAVSEIVWLPIRARKLRQISEMEAAARAYRLELMAAAFRQ